MDNQQALKHIADLILDKKVKEIIVMCGAGISTSCGIPDFRTPKTGLYSQLEAYDLPYAEAIFDLEYFEENPQPFYTLLKSLLSEDVSPSVTHYFLKLLESKKLLKTLFTQNIDNLEYEAGISENLLVEAHGNRRWSACISCKYKAESKAFKEEFMNGTVVKCPKCDSHIKPNIVFFGEGLPPKFFVKAAEQNMLCDLLIIMGTSLQVAPFNSILFNVPDDTPILLINNQDSLGRFLSEEDKDDKKHFKYIGECDAGISELAELLGWKDELHDLLPKKENKEQVKQIINSEETISEKLAQFCWF